MGEVILPQPDDHSGGYLVAQSLRQAGVPIAQVHPPQVPSMVVASSVSDAPPSIPSALEGLVSFQSSSTVYPVDTVD